MARLTMFLREALRKRCLYQFELARKINSDPKVVSRIFVGERKLTPEMALRFEGALGVSAQEMLSIQVADELDRARRTNGYTDTGCSVLGGHALRSTDEGIQSPFLSAPATR